jgi:hypothetical protein
MNFNLIKKNLKYFLSNENLSDYFILFYFILFYFKNHHLEKLPNHLKNIFGKKKFRTKFEFFRGFHETNCPEK